MNKAVEIITLIEGCGRNDRSCQGVLYHWLYEYAMKICYRYAGNYHEAEEITSKSFVNFFKTICRLNARRQLSTEAVLKAWFKKIIVNTCIDSLRRNHTIVNNCICTENNDPPAVLDEAVIDKLSYEQMAEAIKQLTPVYRTIFNLYVIDGMPHEEIASKLNIHARASKRSLLKARDSLRKIISHETLMENNLPTK